MLCKTNFHGLPLNYIVDDYYKLITTLSNRNVYYYFRDLEKAI